MFFNLYSRYRYTSLIFLAIPFLFLAGCKIDKNFDNNISVNEFVLILDENMSSENLSIWQKADWANGNPFYNGWCPNQIAFMNDNMTLSLEQITCQGLSHASGEYRSIKTYHYGKYTTSLKTSDINGTVTSFFTYTGPSEGTEWDEIDIEILGKDPTKMQVNYWRKGVDHPTLIDLGFDASLDFHTYSFIWKPTSISWYVDGILVHTEDGSKGELPVNPGKIIMNLWACTGIDEWCGAYTDGTTTQAIYNYVRFEQAL
jgi:beta-glucanase (GH16 family)